MATDTLTTDTATADPVGEINKYDFRTESKAIFKARKGLDAEIVHQISDMCPAGPQLIANSKQVVGALPGVAAVEVKIVLDPPWTPDKMSDEARDQLGIF